MFINNSFPLQYSTPLYRPPAEGNGLLIQLTIGCSYNKCAFCSMYRSKKYKVRKLSEILEDIEKVNNFYLSKGENCYPRKVFLCDGDALAIPMDTLLPVVEKLNQTFPNLQRISIYASAKNILEKTEKDLKLLKEQKLSLGYIGLESGSNEVLKQVSKGNSVEEIVKACRLLTKSDWKISLIAMLGLGGKELSKIHCIETAKIISIIRPKFLSFLTTVILKKTPFFQMYKEGKITPLSTKELLQEMKNILENINLDKHRIIFRANHVSNQYPAEGILPKDINKLTILIDSWIHQCSENESPMLAEII